MAEVRYYTDEHVSRAVIRGLRNRGIDVLTAVEADMLGASDDAHLELSRSENGVLFTQDADFLRLVATGVAHTGVVYSPQQRSIGQIIRSLALIHQILDAEEMVGQIDFI